MDRISWQISELNLNALAGPRALGEATGQPVFELGAMARGGWSAVKEQWSFRGLYRMLVWRILAVRYKQTLISASWAILQPLSLMAVFTVFFGTLVRIPTEGVPYPLFFFSGLVVWQFVSQALSQASGAIVQNAHILSKVYFPRTLLPAAMAAAACR